MLQRKNESPLLSRRIKCPAVMLAVIRNARVRGRRSALVNSIRVMNGESHNGVEAGRNEEKKFVVLAFKKIIIGLSHRVSPRGKVMVGNVVMEKVYGTKPVRLKKHKIKNVGGINRSQPLKFFCQGAIWAKIKDSREFIVWLKCEGEGQRVGAKNRRSVNEEANEARA